MYLNQYWRDERLAFNIYGPYYDSDADDDGVNDVLTLSGDFAEKIWVPDTFFANDKNRWAFFPLSVYYYIYIDLFSFRSVIMQLPTRRHRTKQIGASRRRRRRHLRHAVHHDTRLHDGFALLPTGLAELHRGNRKL